MKKLVVLVAMLAVVLLASAPALTQTAGSNFELSPVQEAEFVQTVEDAEAVQPIAVDDCGGLGECSAYPSGAEVLPRYRVDCSAVAAPATFCVVDEYGIVTLPDGRELPVEEVSDGAVLDLYTGNLVRFVDGVPVVVGFSGYSPTGVGMAQYDSTPPGL